MEASSWTGFGTGKKKNKNGNKRLNGPPLSGNKGANAAQGTQAPEKQDDFYGAKETDIDTQAAVDGSQETQEDHEENVWSKKEEVEELQDMKITEETTLPRRQEPTTVVHQTPLVTLSAPEVTLSGPVVTKQQYDDTKLKPEDTRPKPRDIEPESKPATKPEDIATSKPPTKPRINRAPAPKQAIIDTSDPIIRLTPNNHDFVSAHRGLLTTDSDYFAEYFRPGPESYKMYSYGTAYENNVISFHNTRDGNAPTIDVLKSYTQWLYTGTIPLPAENKFDHLARAYIFGEKSCTQLSATRS